MVLSAASSALTSVDFFCSSAAFSPCFVFSSAILVSYVVFKATTSVFNVLVDCSMASLTVF